MRQNGKVLVVDDEPEVLALTSEILRRAGYETIVATNAEDALGLCEELKAELAFIVSDVTMPGMNGIELAECVSTMPHPVPVILMSGYPAEHLEKEYGKLGGDWLFVQKPFIPAKLLESICVVANRSVSART